MKLLIKSPTARALFGGASDQYIDAELYCLQYTIGPQFESSKRNWIFVDTWLQHLEGKRWNSDASTVSPAEEQRPKRDESTVSSTLAIAIVVYYSPMTKHTYIPLKLIGN